MDSVSALSWSKKWHIVDLDIQNPDGKYWISRCGVHVARDTDIPYPEHLKNVKRGFSKSTGFCKKCYKSAGVKTVTVELPEPDRRVDKSEYCNAYSVWNHQLFGDEVVVFDDGTFEMFRRQHSDPSILRSAAAVLLAAAEMSDRGQSKNGRQRIVRDRLNRLRDDIAHDRELEIGRAVEFKNAGNDVLAAYHTGLADGRNTVLAGLRALAKEYPGVLD